MFLVEEEVGKLLRISTAALKAWRYRRKGPPFLKIGRRVVYDPVEIEKYLNKCKRRIQE